MFDRTDLLSGSSLIRRFGTVSPAQVSVLIVVLAVVIRLFAPLDADIDWLTAVCRAMLSGKRLYADIVETNPPMAVFIYMPGALIERLTGLPANVVFTVLMLMAGTGVARLFCACARRAGETSAWLLPLTLLVLLIAPLEAFGQREHLALILAMPLLGVAALRMTYRPVSIWLIFVAGLCAGMVPMIKPYFVPGIVTVYIALALQRRDARLLFCSEAVLAACLNLGYGLWLWYDMRAYAHILPMLLDIYIPMHSSLLAPAISLKLIMWLVCLAGLYTGCGRRILKPVPWVLLAASAGFAISFVVQCRGWNYQALPFLSLALLTALLCAVTDLSRLEDRRDRHRMLALLTALVMAAGQQGYFLSFGYLGRGVLPAIRAAVAHPSVMAITCDQSPALPIMSDIDGTWAGTYSSRWVTVHARYLQATSRDSAYRARLQDWLMYDRAVTNSDLRRHPDIVLVGLGPYDWPGWIAADPETRHLFSNYVLLAEDRLTPTQREDNEGIRAYIRRDLISGPPARP